MSENVEIHRDAQRAVVDFLQTRGFVIDAAHFRYQKEVRVTSHEGRAFHAPVTIRVHGATQPPNCAVLAGKDPPTENFIAFVWLGEPSGARFLFLTNQEARDGWLSNGKETEGWHQSGSRAFYGDNDNPPKPDNETVRKLLNAVP